MLTRRANLHARADVWERDGLADRTLREYEPFLKVRDVRSRGRSHRPKSHTVGRIHHLLSDHELGAFYRFDWSSAVDIREQYPLLFRQETIEIAAALGYRHPGFGGVLTIMTTDFLVSWPCGDLEAFAVKPEEELSCPRTIEKLAIEKEYWRRRGIPWTIWTEKEVLTDFTRALHWVHRYYDPSGITINRLSLEEVISRLYAALKHDARETLSAVCRRNDLELNLSPGTSLSVARHAIATGQWSLDLQRGLDPLRPLCWLDES